MADEKVEDIAPPFHGFIATTYDALLVFEAARRGMIPRVTRRLNDTERNMVQSGSVFVYDEQESGIKRWTDGHSWSPSRILANFLVYRETIKPADSKEGKEGTDPSSVKKELTPTRPPTRDGRPLTAGSSTGNASPAGAEMMNAYAGDTSRTPLEAAVRPLAHGQMRPRSAAEAGGCRLENGIYIDRHLERKLVGSLTNSYLFQPGGLVKKTMTLTISGFHQHVVSYYTLEDAVAGRLRRPSTIPEFDALEISPDYLNVANFRYPPSIDIGADGVPRYHGEPDDRPVSPSRGGIPQYGPELYDTYGGGAQLDVHHQPRLRSVTVPNIGATFPSPAYALHPGQPAGYYEPQRMHGGLNIPRQSGPARPPSATRRYDPYASHRNAQLVPQNTGDSGHHRRLSQPPPATDPNYYPGSDYNYQPPSTAPGAFPYYNNSAAPPPPSQPPMASPIVSPTYGNASYGTWHPPAPALRMLPSGRPDLENPPSSSGSLDSAPGSGPVMPSDWAAGLPAANAAPPVWENHPQQMSQPYAVQQGSEGWQASLA